MQLGALIAAPHSGAGKTTLTLGILRALKNRGVDISAAKSGPDYIDPQFHHAATGRASVNLDHWAMSEAELRNRVAGQASEYILIEGAMGALDGAAGGGGSAVDLAATLGLPVVLVIDISKQSQSAVLSIAGLSRLRPSLRIAGVILNRAGSDRHAQMARGAVEDAGYSVFGSIPRNEALELPSRHLGLVQAQEIDALQSFLETAAKTVAEYLDLEHLVSRMGPARAPSADFSRIAPLGQRIAVARDAAFAFSYPHLLSDWRQAGAEISFFSPLANEGPDMEADAVFLPGGYPELHAGKLSSNRMFRFGTKAAARRGAKIYGECGGYMVLGEVLKDADENYFEMLGLLPLETSFAQRKLHLGYREIVARPNPVISGSFAAHEFHYASVLREGDAEPLFDATDAAGENLTPMGMHRGNIAGSFAHLIAARSQTE